MPAFALVPQFPSLVRTLARSFIAAVVSIGALATITSVANAQNVSFFRIGTGGTAGTYYPIGGLLANAISNLVSALFFQGKEIEIRSPSPLLATLFVSIGMAHEASFTQRTF